MSIDDIPNLKSTQFPERVTVCVSEETKLKIKSLKAQRKDVPELLRQAFDKALKDVAV